MASKLLYEPTYLNSWALVVGINRYRHISPLGCARHDAEAIAEVLETKFGFHSKNITLLLDGDAARNRIMSCLLRMAEGHVSHDDRVVVFFAGHGYTRMGRRGEVGYLVPEDGDPADLSTLIRWDEVTRNADLIRAKHILFLMDACYGGLAVTRALHPGSARFLKDMLQRYARQVLTAGKADEVVADAGGTRIGHSMFTGHLLDALDGAAATGDGVLTANAVMSYVYDRVAKDLHSQQTPHYGFIDGDGDLIFQAPILQALAAEETVDKDVLIYLPATSAPPDTEQLLPDTLKDLLSDPRYRIRLDDLVAAEIRRVLHDTREELFPLETSTASSDEFAERLRQYEDAVERLLVITILVARWGSEEHQPVLARIIARLADKNDVRSGLVSWLGLRWYPLTLVIYSGGISALSGQNYRSLATLVTTQLGDQLRGGEPREAIVPTVEGMLDVRRTRLFKQLPGHDKYFVPESEYLFKSLQPVLEDHLFLGNSYEDLFDRFEMLQALVYADLATGQFWGPTGRFGWKHRRMNRSPFEALVTEAEREGEAWPPLRFGLFAGSIDRFREVASDYRQLLQMLSWD